jgi:hypothetical protein
MPILWARATHLNLPAIIGEHRGAENFIKALRAFWSLPAVAMRGLLELRAGCGALQERSGARSKRDRRGNRMVRGRQKIPCLIASRETLAPQPRGYLPDA